MQITDDAHVNALASNPAVLCQFFSLISASLLIRVGKRSKCRQLRCTPPEVTSSPPSGPKSISDTVAQVAHIASKVAFICSLPAKFSVSVNNQKFFAFSTARSILSFLFKFSHPQRHTVRDVQVFITMSASIPVSNPPAAAAKATPRQTDGRGVLPLLVLCCRFAEVLFCIIAFA